MIITTVDSLDGYVTEEYKGLARSDKCNTEYDAFRIIQKYAKSMGANAILGLRVFSSEIEGETFFYCYGTAVVLKKVNAEKKSSPKK